MHHDQNQPAYPQHISGHPEHAPIQTNAVEYSHLQEIIEPQVTEELNAYIEHQNPQYIPQPQIPIQTTTPLIPIHPVQPTKVPLNDFEIEKGLHSKVMTSFRALAIWCIRQLQISDYKNKQHSID